MASDKSFSDKLEAFGTLGVAPAPNINAVKPPPISPQEKELAQAALQDYTKANYSSCIANLSKLEALRPKDQKLILNKAVALFQLSSQKDTEALANQLANVETHLKEEESDIQSFLLYNHSLILFRTGQFSSALKQLLKAFNFIESMDEGLSQRVSLLMLEVLLCLGQPTKALALLSYVESQLLGLVSHSPHGGSMIPLLDRTPILPPGASIRHKKEPATKPPAEPTTTVLPAFEQEWLKAKLATLRARAIVLARTLKTGENEINAVLAVQKPGFNNTMLMLKSHLEYLRFNFNNSARLLSLTTPPEGLESGDSPGVMWYNNIACAHFNCGRNRLAIRYLNRASEETKNLSTNSEFPVRFVHAQLAMNIGLILLHSEQPEAAFPHLLRAARHFPSNPRLWLRLAECCIHSKHPSNAPGYDFEGHGKDILKGTIACASGRKLILASSLSKPHVAEKQTSNPTLSLEFASLCLRNALLLLTPVSSASDSSSKLSNTLGSDRSDNNSPPGISQPLSGVSTLLETLNAPPSSPQCLPSSPLNETEIDGLRISILAASAYVSLCLGEPMLAVEHAKALLDLPALPGAYRLLGHLYAAEGLLQLDQISEAIDLLQPDTLPADLSLTLPDPVGVIKGRNAEIRPQVPWEPTSVVTARATMLYNLAVAYAIRGNLDKASHTISAVWACNTDQSKVPIHLIMLSIYVELQQGHIQNARNLLIKYGVPHHQ